MHKVLGGMQAKHVPERTDWHAFDQGPVLLMERNNVSYLAGLIGIGGTHLYWRRGNKKGPTHGTRPYSATTFRTWTGERHAQGLAIERRHVP